MIGNTLDFEVEPNLKMFSSRYKCFNNQNWKGTQCKAAGNDLQ